MPFASSHHPRWRRWTQSPFLWWKLKQIYCENAGHQSRRWNRWVQSPQKSNNIEEMVGGKGWDGGSGGFLSKQGTRISPQKVRHRLSVVFIDKGHVSHLFIPNWWWDGDGVFTYILIYIAILKQLVSFWRGYFNSVFCLLQGPGWLNNTESE